MLLKKICAISMTAFIAGCSTYAAPNYFEGNYYMAGDNNCVRFRPLFGNRIMCVDKNGRDTEPREALTYGQLQAYQMHMQQQQAQFDSLNLQLQQTAQSFQSMGQAQLQQSQNWSPPQAQPIPQYGGQVTTYRQVGNTILRSDGRTCQNVGQTLICN